jgi:hypothetical protein
LVRDDPPAGCHQRLCHIATGEDFLPNTLCELVAAVGGASAEPGKGLEEQAPPLAPEAFGVLRVHDLGMRNSSQQYVLGGLWYAQRLQPRCIAEQGQVALVRVQRVRLGVWREHHCIGQVGLAQRRAGGLGQQKIG